MTLNADTGQPQGSRGRHSSGCAAARLSGTNPEMSDLSARVSPEVAALEAQLEALGDWRAQLDTELAEMAAATRRIGKLARRA